jgi:hypothetical protein
MQLLALSWLALLGLARAQVLPAPKGRFTSQWTNHELIDESRQDPFNETSVRRIMISKFAPVPKEKCVKTCTVPYMPPEIAAIEDDIVVEYLAARNLTGWPPNVFAGLEVEVCCKKAKDCKEKYPTILLGTGLNTTRLFFTATAQTIAALGYEVIVMDHTYETDVVQFPDGEIVFGGHVGRSEDMDELLKELQLGLDVRAQDTKFVMDNFEIDKTVFIGISFGGPAALAAMQLEPERIVGGVNVDGSLYGRAVEQGVDRPFLIIGSTGHNSSNVDFDPTWQQFWDAMDEKYPNVWTRELSLDDTLHNAYYDNGIIADAAGLRDNEELVDGFFGRVTGEHVREFYEAYLGDFIDFTLLGGEEGLLKEESPDWPDVHFLR